MTEVVELSVTSLVLLDGSEANKSTGSGSGSGYGSLLARSVDCAPSLACVPSVACVPSLSPGICVGSGVESLTVILLLPEKRFGC